MENTKKNIRPFFKTWTLLFQNLTLVSFHLPPSFFLLLFPSSSILPLFKASHKFQIFSKMENGKTQKMRGAKTWNSTWVTKGTSVAGEAES